MDITTFIIATFCLIDDHLAGKNFAAEVQSQC
jgi:hypothetical protein